ncbi:phage holin family protein [Georgenia daeguensis]|uniref:Phage holin family protein n=1 Tax=Georgenia daeguensis TaxID=908355 RepID=A0ABP8EP86_9MICO
MRFLVQLLVNAAAIWVADWLLEGISLAPTSSTGATLLELAVVAAVFTLVNLIVRPVVALLSLPFYILTLGLFFLVVNALMLMLTGWITSFTDYGLRVDGFWTAVLGGLVIAIASWILHLVIPGDRRRGDRR